MSKFSTLNYLFNSYQAGKKEIESLFLSDHVGNNDWNLGIEEQEPSQSCIDTILSFASQCEVLKSNITGNIELNLN